MLAPPVLVVGPPGPNPARVAAMLGGHPQAQHLPELYAFLAPTIEGLLALFALTDGTPSHGLLRAVAAINFGGQTDDTIQQARFWLQRRADWTGAQLLDALSRALAPRVLITADTDVGWRPDQLDRLLDTCPDLRVLHLIENPRPWCLSRAEALKGRLFVAPDFKDYGVNPPIVDGQLAWHRVHTNVERAFEASSPSQYRRLRLEDLHGTPDITLAGLCDWLGLVPSPEAIAAMQRPERSAFAGYGPQSASHGADEAFLESPFFLRRLPTRDGLKGPLPWRPDGQGFAREVAELALGYGYR